MESIKYLNESGDFELNNPEMNSGLYFPLVNEGGNISSVTPLLAGDCKKDQNTFLMPPVSIENLHNDRATRNFWCLIHGKKAWSATGVSAWQQALTFSDKKEKTSMSAGPLWQKVSRQNHELGISSDILSFCPPTDDAVEIMCIKITNISKENLTFTPTAAIPLYGRSADNIRDHRHVTSLLNQIKMNQNGITLSPTLTFDERGHHKGQNFYGVFANSKQSGQPKGYFPTIKDFIGEGGSLEWPEAVVKNLNPTHISGEIENGYEALGGIRFADITLSPEQSETFIIVMGIDVDGEKYLDIEKIDNLLEENKQYWNKQIGTSIYTQDDDFNKWMRWVSLQPTLRRICGCSFMPHHDYGKGGRGWRDLWQDTLALILVEPQKVRSSLISYFDGVRIDGSNATIIGKKPGEFIADRNNIVRVWMDHGVWPMRTVDLYIQQTGDINLLLEKSSYFYDKQLCRGEKINPDWSCDDGVRLKDKEGNEYQSSILEHLIIENLSAVYDVGEHNHLRLRGADWNDGLDMAKERGESIAFSAAYTENLDTIANYLQIISTKHNIKTIPMLSELKILFDITPEALNDWQQKRALLNQYFNATENLNHGKIDYDIQALANKLRMISDWMRNHIRNTQWIESESGFSWFNSYYDNHGQQAENGSINNTRMMLTGQVFTVLSNTATQAQTENIIKSADRFLFDANCGGYRLNTNFNEVKLDMGRMFGFAYGHKENGAVFSHMAVMYAFALYSRGFAKEGWKALNTLYKQSSNFQSSRIYPGIPEYFDPNGRGMYHYLTGAASWYLLTVQTEMFGVKGKNGDLLIDPKLLKEQFNQDGKASICLTFAGIELTIDYHNEKLLDYGEYKVIKATISDKVIKAKNGQLIIPKEQLLSLNLAHQQKAIISICLSDTSTNE